MNVNNKAALDGLIAATKDVTNDITDNNNNILSQNLSSFNQDYKEIDLPNALKNFAEKSIWVCFSIEKTDEGKIKKIPINPHNGEKASISDPSTWGTFDQAKKSLFAFRADPLYRNKSINIGIALNKNLGIIAIDLDHVYDSKTDSLETWAKEIIEKCNSYTEISLSGSGIHIYGYGYKKTDKCRKGKIEIYSLNRFIIVTNNPYGDIKPLRDITDEVDLISKKLGFEESISNISGSNRENQKKLKFSDEEIIQKARNAKNNLKFKALFEDGNTVNYPSHSEADLALCSLIAFFTDDFEQIERIWRKSALWRDKGDKRKDYVNKTIQSSLKVKNNAFIGDQIRHQNKTQKEILILPGGDQTISESGQIAGKLLKKTNKFFIRNKKLVEIIDGANSIVSPDQFCSDIETVAFLKKVDNKNKLKPAILTKEIAVRIMASKTFLNELPQINIMSNCPLLILENKKLIQIKDYYQNKGILITGGDVIDVKFDEAIQLLKSILVDFSFCAEADKSRAMAAILTPALIFGKIIEGRSPIMVIEADDSQAGKGYLVKVITAIYNAIPETITQKNGGVGSLEESFNACLIKGKPFISIDNYRGKINIPAIESFMTEDRYLARIPHTGNIEIDPRGFFLFMTSNKAELTTDFANRSFIIRIKKQPLNYKFKSFQEGDLLDHLKANQKKYLGAIFAVIKQYHEHNYPKTIVFQHSFKKMGQSIDWIVQNFFGFKSLLDGHDEAQQRVTNPHLNWLRDIALALIQSSKNGLWLRTVNIIEFCYEIGLEIFDEFKSFDFEDIDIRKKILTSFGRRIASCFKDKNEIVIEDIKIERKFIYETRGAGSGPQEVKEYRFTSISSLHNASIEPLSASNASITSDISVISNVNDINHIDISEKKDELNGGDEGIEALKEDNNQKISIKTTCALVFNDPVLGSECISIGEIGFLSEDLNFSEKKRLNQLEKEGKPSNIVILRGKKRILSQTDFEFIK